MGLHFRYVAALPVRRHYVGPSSLRRAVETKKFDFNFREPRDSLSADKIKLKDIILKLLPSVFLKDTC